MSSSYKPALLKALVRIIREAPSAEITTRPHRAEFVRLYWVQTAVFHLRHGPKTPALYQQLPGPILGYGPGDFASIYDIYPAYQAGYSGHGTTAALPECGIINRASTQLYELTYGLPQTSVELISVDGTAPTDEQLGVEPALDAERIIGTAPAAKVKMYFIDGDTCDLGAFADALAQIANDDDATDVSVSYGLSEATWGFIGAEEDLEAWQAGVEAIADEGIPVFASSGDSGAWSDYNDNAIDPLFPASNPKVLAVGGTTI
jgi:subtilase family serine protease